MLCCLQKNIHERKKQTYQYTYSFQKPPSQLFKPQRRPAMFVLTYFSFINFDIDFVG